MNVVCQNAMIIYFAAMLSIPPTNSSIDPFLQSSTLAIIPSIDPSIPSNQSTQQTDHMNSDPEFRFRFYHPYVPCLASSPFIPFHAFLPFHSTPARYSIHHHSPTQRCLRCSSKDEYGEWQVSPGQTDKIRQV